MRRRLDTEMVRRGMAASRSEATEAIRSGRVTVSGRPAAKAAMLVLPEEAIAVGGPVRTFVSRAGEKLEAALDAFGIDVTGRHALDAGASTGGFSDCLLSRGVAHVIAVDVGYGQLDWKLRGDPRVTVLDRTNVRDLKPGDLPYAPDVTTADLSFISLRVALPALIRCSAPAGTFVLLVKPQFEAGREDAPGGVVRDPAVWARVLVSVAEACAAEGLQVGGVMASPLLGPAGNVEFLVAAERHAARPGPLPASLADLHQSVASAVDQARSLASSRHG